MTTQTQELTLQDLIEFAKLHGACDEAVAWMEQQPCLEHAWYNCHRSDWITWLLLRAGYNKGRNLRLYAVACVRETPLSDGRVVADLLTDSRSIAALEVAVRHAHGNATDFELAAARAAAWAAARAAAWDAARDAARDAASAAARAAARAAAWDAAWDAARAAAWDAQSKILRRYIALSDVVALIQEA